MELYEYRRESQARAREMLKQIESQEHFLGQANIKLRDAKDWNSLQSATQRLEKEKNIRLFEGKYGDGNIAYRSIASQSAYNSSSKNEFRRREKSKEMHARGMRFTARISGFSNIGKESIVRKAKRKSIVQVDSKAEQEEMTIRRASSNYSGIGRGQQDNRSMAHSIHSRHQSGRISVDESQRLSALAHQQANKDQPNPSSKVYFKQIIDLQQHLTEKSARNSLQQILVRFGINRIKDFKKQAMVQIDNLSLGQL